MKVTEKHLHDVLRRLDPTGKITKNTNKFIKKNQLTPQQLKRIKKKMEMSALEEIFEFEDKKKEGRAGELFEFVRLNTAKKTLRRLRARSGRKGKRLIRNNEGINASIADSPMADAPGLERRNTAYVARKDFASKKQPAPRNVGIHEEAHLADHLNTRAAEAVTRTQNKNAAKFLADQKAGVSADEALKPVIKSGNKINRVEIKRETRANRRALKEMKAAGASKADIADYTSWAQGQMKEGYRNPYFDDMLNQKGNRSLSTAKKVLKENPHLRKVKLSSLEGIFEFE